MGRFRHRAAKFHSTSIIPPTRRADTLGHFRTGRGSAVTFLKQKMVGAERNEGNHTGPVLNSASRQGGSYRADSKNLPFFDS